MIINSTTILGLRTNLRATFQGAFKGVATTWDQVATRVPSDTDKETYGWLGDIPQIREFLGERQVKNLETFDYTLKNRKFELTLGVKRDDMADNKLAGYGIKASDMGQKAAKFPDRLVWDVVKNGHQSKCYDGQYFFDTDHPVGDTTVSNSLAGAATPWFLLDLSGVLKPFLLQVREEFEFTALDKLDDPNVFFKEEFLYGIRGRMNAGYGLWQFALRSAATLDEANFDAARKAMQAFKSPEGELLGIRPTHIVVPPGLELAANKLFNVQTYATAGDNALYQAVKVIVAPWLG